MIKHRLFVICISISIAIIVQQAYGNALTSLLSVPSHEPLDDCADDTDAACGHIRTNIKPATFFTILLIIFSFIVEWVTHKIEHALENREQLLKIVQAIYKELMILGLIAILVFVLKQSKASEHVAHWMTQLEYFKIDYNLLRKTANSHDALFNSLSVSDQLCYANQSAVPQCTTHSIDHLFEKVHLGISSTMGIYFLVCLYLVYLHWHIYKHWYRIDTRPFDTVTYERLLNAHRDAFPLFRYLHFPRMWKLWSLRGIDRIHALRLACIEQYGLPSTFPFSTYLKLCMRDVVIQVLEVAPLCWGVLILGLALNLARVSIFRQTNNGVFTVLIYSTLSGIVGALSVANYILASKLYHKVLTLPSISKFLNTLKCECDLESGEDSIETPPRTDIQFNEKTRLLNQDSSFNQHSSSKITCFTPSHEFSQEIVDRSKDHEQHDFALPTSRKNLQFKIFQYSGHDTVRMMSVDEYRIYNSRVKRIMRRAGLDNEEDESHKTLLFFKSRRFLIATLQLLVFIQVWLFGLSVYYAYSQNKDKPPPQQPAGPGLMILLFIGPILTFGLMGPTLAMLVKGIYSGGLVRPDILLEALFSKRALRTSDYSKVLDISKKDSKDNLEAGHIDPDSVELDSEMEQM